MSEFSLGSFAVSEVLYGVAQNFEDEILYTLDQLSSAQIEVSSDPVEITDKNGSVIRNIYKNKSATFTATSALLSPAIMNAGSGSDAQIATATNKISMPKIEVVGNGAVVTLDETASNIQVISMFGNGANGHTLKADTKAKYDTATGVYTYAYDETEHTVTMPSAVDGTPTQFLIKYDRDTTNGMKIVNNANKFPDTIQLTLYVALVDPCDDQLRAAYVYLPSFQPDPSMTISLDSDSQEVDYTGAIQVDYCSCDKALYYILFPDESAVTSAVCE